MTQKVFFLGAGFSKAVNGEYPLMSDLTTEALAHVQKSSAQKHLEELAPKIKQNIESLLTYLSTDLPWKTDTTKYANKSLYCAIVQALSEIFTEYAKQAKPAGDRNSVWWKFADKVRLDAKKYNFITLNYDILLEVMLKGVYPVDINTPRVTYADFYSYPMTAIANRIPKPAFVLGSNRSKPAVPKILKLHGSANWFWAGVSASDILYYKQDYNKYSSSEPETLTYGLKPYIIPPMLDKSSFYNHIAIHSLWKQAEELLQNADEIYIIGFSFPQTDLAVKYLFQSALRKRNPKIYVVNSAPRSALIANYQAVFGDIDLNYVCTGHSNVVTEFITQKILDEVEPHV